MNYKVTYAIDSLDTNPVIKTFDEEYEALEWLENEVQERISWTVEHSPYTISKNEYQRNLNIVHAVTMNDEVYLKKILQYEV